MEHLNPKDFTAYKLIPEANLADFLLLVANCRGEIFFFTEEDDVLNLKSTLSQYMFVIITKSKDFHFQGKIAIQFQEDHQLLRHFFTD